MTTLYGRFVEDRHVGARTFPVLKDDNGALWVMAPTSGVRLDVEIPWVTPNDQEVGRTWRVRLVDSRGGTLGDPCPLFGTLTKDEEPAVAPTFDTKSTARFGVQIRRINIELDLVPEASA